MNSRSSEQYLDALNLSRLWRLRKHCVSIASAVLAIACSDNSQHAVDASLASDAAITDATITDATTLDAARLDAAPLDAAPLDAAPLDAAPLDAAASSDAQSTDSGLDASSLDAGVDASPKVSCNSAPILLPGVPQQGDTSVLSNTGSASCSPGSNLSKDAAYRVLLPMTPTDLLVRVTVDEDVEQPYDTVVSVQSECDELSSELACSDFGYSDSLAALGLTGEVFVRVDGTPQFGGSPTGPYEIEIQTRNIREIGQSCESTLTLSRCSDGLRCVSGTCEADNITIACQEAIPLSPGIPLQMETHAFHGDLMQGSCAFDASSAAPEQLFSFTLATESNVSITTNFPETNFDTVLYLQGTCNGAQLGCADDIDPQAGNFRSTLNLLNLPAGSYTVVVDGSSTAAPSGTFKIQLTI